MKKTIVLYLLLFSSTISFAQVTQVCAGNIEIYQNFASTFVAPRNVSVWLPENYYPKKKYAVLYMHDGQMLFDSTKTWNKQEWGVDECITKLFRQGKIKNVIVVGIWNTDNTRHPEYFPQKPFESLSVKEKETVSNSLQKRGITVPFKPFSDNYLKFIVEELKPFIDKTYSTRKEKENTFIAGSSMGGLISMYAMCEYPEVFGGAACLSTHWPGTFEIENNPIPNAFINYLKTNLPDSKSHKFYFDFGTGTLDAMYPPLQAKVDEVMQTKGYTNNNWITQKIEGAEHSENAWRVRLHIPFEFLLKK